MIMSIRRLLKYVLLNVICLRNGCVEQRSERRKDRLSVFPSPAATPAYGAQIILLIIILIILL